MMTGFILLSETHWASEPIVIIGAITVVSSIILLVRRSKTRLPEIMDAAHEKDLEKFKLALQNKKCNINAVDINGFTPLILVIVNFGQKYLVEEVLAKNPTLDWQDRYGNTALHYAALRSKTPIIRMLLEKNANKNITNKEGKTPIQIAIENNKPEIVELLS